LGHRILGASGKETSGRKKKINRTCDISISGTGKNESGESLRALIC